MKYAAPLTTLIFGLMTSLSTTTLAQDATLPPKLGEETKGKPAVDETAQLPEEAKQQQPAKKETLLGKTKITESRRESGQLYLIEIESATGAKQYIEEFDSNGIIESTPSDIEETPNLPKWKISSW